MKPLRVLVVTTSYPSAARPADAIFVHTQCRALARLGVEIKVLAPTPWVPRLLLSWNTRWDLYHSLPGHSSWEGVDVLRPRYLALPRANYWYVPHLHYARAAEQMRAWRPGLVHAHMGYPAGLAGVVIARRWGVPSFVTLHGSDIHIHPDKSPFYQRHIRSALRQATGVIAVSNALAEGAERLAGRRPSVLPIGIDLPRFARLQDKAAARKSLKLPADKKLLLFVGSLLKEKGLPEIAALMAELAARGVALAIVGDGPLKAMARAIPGAICTGLLPNEMVAQYMRAADLLLLPSRSEGMPTVLIEAGASGLPVAASNVGGVPELLGQDRGWGIQPGSVPALKEAVLEALADPSEAACRSARLRDFVIKEYDAAENARRLLAMYAELAEAARSGARRALP